MSGRIAFLDGSFPGLEAGSYTIAAGQKLAGPESPAYTKSQKFEVEAPRFAIDPNAVRAAYPPPGGNGDYSAQLPFVSLDDASLPWERGIEPGGGTPDVGSPQPWVALAVFAEGEIRLQPDSGSPLAATTVAGLLQADLEVLKPEIPSSTLSPGTPASPCQTITVTGEAFEAVLPWRTELPYLAHCRAINQAGEGSLLISVATANRLPVAGPAPRRYYAHLVSLEGFGEYLGPEGEPVPEKPGGEGELCDVQLASLWSWSFVSQPGSGLGFEALLKGLIANEQVTPTLRLPPPPTSLPPKASARIEEGYAPLPFVSGAGEQSFAWYRGPLTPVVAQPLPEVGEPPVPANEATSADALTIYLAEEGLFDLSYAAAWNAGRQLALADARFAEAMAALRRQARSALGLLAQRLDAPHLEGAEPEDLLAVDLSRRRFRERVGAGMTSGWTAAMASARAGARPAGGARRSPRPHRRAHLDPLAVLEQPWAPELLARHLDEAADPVADWLERLSRFGSLSFSHLVPDPAMLPPESVRFFYVDQNWVDALRAGALSIAAHSSADVALLRALRPSLEARLPSRGDEGSAGLLGGLLIRSQLVSAWPALVVRGSQEGTPLENLRDDCPSESVRLCLFDGVPDEVSIGEPYQGLSFGLVGGAVEPRVVTARAATGARLGGVKPVKPKFRDGEAGRGVLEVETLAKALAQATGVVPFGPQAVVQWNGEALATKVLGPRLLEATVAKDRVESPGTATVAVADGGRTSAPARFAIEGGETATEPAPGGEGETEGLAIRSLEPGAAVAGAEELPLNVFGSGFGTGATIDWNGVPLKTTWHDPERLSAKIPASSLQSAATAKVTVVEAGGSSLPAEFPVLEPGPAIGALEPASAIAGGEGFTLRVVGGFGAGDFALQMVEAPQRQAFLPTPEAGAAP